MAISVSGISPMSMNPIMSVRSVETKPQNYAVENQSDVSDAFSQSLAVNGASGIMGPPPVQYANAQVSENETAQAGVDSARANRYFNDIASAYQGMSTSYNANGAAEQYSMVGNSIDLMA